MNNFEIGEMVWYKGHKCEVVDRLNGRLYALSYKGKDVKGMYEDGFVSERELSVVTPGKIEFF